MLSISKRELYAFVIIAQHPFITIGGMVAFMAYLLPQLEVPNSDISISKDMVSWMATSSLLLQPIGCILEFFTIDKIGRKKSIQLSLFANVVFCTMYALSPNVTILLFSLILHGIFIGMNSSSTVYLSEIAQDQNRASMLASLTPCGFLGIFVIYVTEYFLSWRVTAMIIAVYSATAILLLNTIPETKYFYMLKGDLEKAKQSAAWFNCSPDIGFEMVEKQRQQEADNISFLQSISNPKHIKHIIALSFLYAFQQCSGEYVISTYCVELFNSLGTDYEPEILGIILGFVVLVSTTLSVFVVSHFKRKTMIISSGIIRILFLAAIIVYFVLNPNGNRQYQFFPVLCVFAFSFFEVLGTQEVIWIIIPEMFPSSIRGSVSAFLYMIAAIFAIISVFAYPYVNELVHFTGVGTIFAFCSLAMILITHFFIPETSNVILSELDNIC